MIAQTLIRIFHSTTNDLQAHAQMLLKHGIEKVIQQLSKPDLGREIYPEQVIKLLSVLHYMMQNNQLPMELFQECRIYLITNILNNSFVNERLSTEMSSSSTFARSSHQSSRVSNQQQPLQNQFCFSESKKDKVYQKRMECLQTFSDNAKPTQRYTIREPLTYQSMLQLYYTYLKKISHKLSTGHPLVDSYVLENIQAMGLRLIEGQKCPNLRYCFQLIIKDLVQIQLEIIKQMEKLINLPEYQKDAYEIFSQQQVYEKQLKFYGQLNKQTIDQSNWKQFKLECKDFVMKSKQQIRKCKFQQTDRMSVSEFKTDNVNYDYERKQIYNQY